MSKAPDLPVSLDWLNVDHPPLLSSLRGKVVLVVFWCYSNCHSVRLLPAIRQLQQERDPGVAVIGMHCPKFDHERDPDNVRRSLSRNFVRFPMASDHDFEAWRRFGVDAWPSVAVIDAQGQWRDLLRGDDMVERLTERVDELLEEADVSGTFDVGRVPQGRMNPPTGFLRYPTAVLEARGMIYVSDAANNRIVELSKEGRVQRIFGSGNPGLWDGVAAHCGFNLPRGLAYAENFLYVADTGNHAIRRINLFSGEVETVVGNGKPELTMTTSTRRMQEIGLPLPVGLAFHGPDLYISVSGVGQIWRLDLANGTIGWFSGTGQHGVLDGDPVQAAFAQPMGLAATQNFIYVADADGSAIREIRVPTGHIRTRSGQNPFVFGHDDGPPARALMQYPSDVAVRERLEQLWIADSFNDRLRVLDLRNGHLETPDIDYDFSEPAGISLAGNTLWIANTNHHEIVRYDLVTKRCEPLEIAVAA